jgi:hypothetical protein
LLWILGFFTFFGALDLGCEIFTGAGAGSLPSAFLDLAAREGWLRRGGEAIVVIVGRKP